MNYSVSYLPQKLADIYVNSLTLYYLLPSFPSFMPPALTFAVADVLWCACMGGRVIFM